MTTPKLLTILVIDDDPGLREAVSDYFEPSGYKVFGLEDGDSVPDCLGTYKPSVVLLDITLPRGQDGFAVLARIRRVSAVPVIMLTARGDEIDRVLGLEMGADDYLSKPFSLRELLARVKALLRRGAFGSEACRSSLNGAFVTSKGFSLEAARRRLLFGELSAELSLCEANILRVLMENPGIVLERDRLIKLAMGEDHNISSRGVDVHVSHIRGTLKKLAPSLSPILTVRGSGYLWEES